MTRGGVMIEFSEMRGPNKMFGSFCEINEPNILFGPLISENSIVKPPLVDQMIWANKKGHFAKSTLSGIPANQHKFLIIFHYLKCLLVKWLHLSKKIWQSGIYYHLYTRVVAI